MDQNLIETVNKLQDVFAALGNTSNPIDLPQIAVVGSQSSGKSSVLENIVGQDFLPRGSGIVTRRPLVLQLSHTKRGTNKLRDGETLGPNDSVDEWGEFLHNQGKRYYDFNAIRQEIVAETERVTGTNVGISAAPITLRVFSHKVLTLTLVDLPGLTKVPVGDQPPDIERQIREMILKFISKPSCIILSVTAANTDLANSDGLKLAREVDPQGVRTIGVLTKIDLMDKGTDVVDILAQKVIKLRLGFVPVINRSQRDIETNKSIEAALDYERNFFENHPKYAVNAKYTGTRHLADRLSKLLLMHIRSTLPDTKNKIITSLVKYREELAQLGGDLSAPGVSPSNILLDIITKLSNEYRTILDGNSDELSTSELSGGARISFVFHELYGNGIKAVDPFEHVQDVDIRTILYNSSGSSPALFVATQGFEVIVKQQIRRFEEPSIRCISLIYDELVRITNQILQQPSYKRYPQLRDVLYNETLLYLRSLVGPTNKLVSDMIGMEASYVNTGHPDFVDGHTAMAIVSEKYKPSQPAAKGKNAAPAEVPATQTTKEGFFGSIFGGTKASKKKMAAMDAPPPVLKASGTLSEREMMETDVIKLLIQSYFNIVKRTTVDMIPKAIMLNLVERSKSGLQGELVKKLYASQTIEPLLKESDFVVERRNECTKMVTTLEKAAEVLESMN